MAVRRGSVHLGHYDYRRSVCASVIRGCPLADSGRWKCGHMRAGASGIGGNGGSSTRVQANAGFRKPAEPRDIVKLVQIDEDGEPVKEWYIMGQTSLLIGKSNPMQEVEIDLADSEYASLISSVHAVLNRVNQEWFIEDNDSASGTGVRAASRSTAMKLQSGEPCRINSGICCT